MFRHVLDTFSAPSRLQSGRRTPSRQLGIQRPPGPLEPKEVDVSTNSGGSSMDKVLDAVIIGAGQAGLSAAYHLQRRGLVPEQDYIVLDANEGPGGAWRHRWPSLTFDAAHGLH